MKVKWIIVIVVLVLLILIGLAVLQDRGLIEIKWQTLSILLAALIAPYKYLSSLFTSNKDKIAAIKEQHATVRNQEHKYQQQLENKIKQRDERVDVLNKQIEVLNSKVKILEDQNSKVEAMVSNMTVDEKKEKFKELFGE